MPAPAKASLAGLEERWARRWREAGTYRFDRSQPRARVFSIDTAPQTVGGALHAGHVFGYARTDVIARFQRMHGFEVFFPVAWDDNGLPTERYARAHGDAARAVERHERELERSWRLLGVSFTWEHGYRTDGRLARAASQRSFLALVRSERVQARAAPTLWDVETGSAVTRAETVERELAADWHRLALRRADGGTLEVGTMRPELLSACVAVLVHPDDERHAALRGTHVALPLSGAQVPVLTHAHVDPGAGSGAVAACTFGDPGDLRWWRELALPLRIVVGADGRLTPAAGAELAGLEVADGRARAVALLEGAGALAGPPLPCVRRAAFAAHGSRPLELIATRQWFLPTRPLARRLLALGREVAWHPPGLRARYEAWVNDVDRDWCLSRRRSRGVPIPIWYPLDARGRPCHERPLLPDPAALPVDPANEAPAGFEPAQRDRPGGFTADPDVLDTWATSSLSPRIAGNRDEDPDLFGRVSPFDLRPQSHQLIPTWLFYSLVRAELEQGRAPWRAAAISGRAVDPVADRLTSTRLPDASALLERYGADAIHHWAASARLGAEAVLDDGRLRAGRRLALKLLNVARFVLDRPLAPGPLTHAVDVMLLTALARTVEAATAELLAYEQSRALAHVERAFWRFCNGYVELVKPRANGAAGVAGAGSAHAALTCALSLQLRLLAPYLPFAAEEAWCRWRRGSIHRAPWPTAEEIRALLPATPLPAPGVDADGDVALDVADAVVGALRAAKARAGLPQRTRVRRVCVGGDARQLAALALVEDDLCAAGRVDAFAKELRTELRIEVEAAG